MESEKLAKYFAKSIFFFISKATKREKLPPTLQIYDSFRQFL